MILKKTIEMKLQTSRYHHGIMKAGLEHSYRAGHNGRSMENVRPDWGCDQSNVGLACQVDQTHSIISK